jgi:hypothetical protein
MSRFVLLAAIGILSACTRKKPQDNSGLHPYFQALDRENAVLVSTEAAGERSKRADTIPNRVFFKMVPPSLLREIDYLADSSEALVLGHFHFPLDDDNEAYWVEIQQFWFKHHSLLVYHRPTHSVTDRVTLAEWYGGEGGQTLIGSWIGDFDQDCRTDIFTEQMDHSIRMEGDSVRETHDVSLSLQHWIKGRFKPGILSDSAGWLRRFPVPSAWAP